MPVFEYKVVPAPSKGQKSKGVKGSGGRFAFALQTVMNDMATDGWEYQRTETLPSQDRSGLGSTTTTFRNVMVFRRPRADDVTAFNPRLLERPAFAKQPDHMPPRESAKNTEHSVTPEKARAPFAPETGEPDPLTLPVALVARAQSITETDINTGDNTGDDDVPDVNTDKAAD